MRDRIVIEQDSDRFITEYDEEYCNPREKFLNTNYKSLLQSRLKLHDRSENKILFLDKAKDRIYKLREEHLIKCNFPNNRDECPETSFYNGLMYYTQQVYDKLTEEVTSKNSFTPIEKVDINSRIDEVLDKLNELQLGQNIIFNEITELRNLTNLDKNVFKDVVKGKIVDIVISKAIEPQTLSWIYSKLTNDIIPPLLNC